MQTTRLETERTSKVYRQRGDQGLDVLRYWVQHILGIAFFDWEADLVRTIHISQHIEILSPALFGY